MALIPSESASFPDLLGRGLGASKKSKWRIPDEIALPVAAPQAPKAEPVAEPNISSEALPSAEIPEATPPPAVAPAVETLSVAEPAAAEAVAAPTPVLEEKKVEAPTHAPIPIVRIARSIADRATESNPDLLAPATPAPISQEQPSVDPSLSVPVPPVRPRLRPRPVLHPRFKTEEVASDPVDSDQPASEALPGGSVPSAPQYVALQDLPTAPADNAEEFGFLESAEAWPILQRRRRRARLLRFILWELFVLTVTGVAIKVGLTYRLVDDPVALAAKIVAIVFAIAAVALPVVFYGLPETGPPADR